MAMIPIMVTKPKRGQNEILAHGNQAETKLKQFGATPVHVWCCSNTLELRLCMSGAAQTLWSNACACAVLNRTSNVIKKNTYEITSCYHGPIRGEDRVSKRPGSAQRTSRNHTFGNRAPGPHTLRRIYIEASMNCIALRILMP